MVSFMACSFLSLFIFSHKKIILSWNFQGGDHKLKGEGGGQRAQWEKENLGEDGPDEGARMGQPDKRSRS